MVHEEVGTYNAMPQCNTKCSRIMDVDANCSHLMGVYIKPVCYAVNLSSIRKQCFIRKYQIICKQKIKVKLSTRPIIKINAIYKIIAIQVLMKRHVIKMKFI